MQRVAGKIALVTGVGSLRGIGFATAKRLAEEGATVFISDINKPGLAECAAQFPGVTPLHHDVTLEAHWDNVFALILAAHGRLDVLVNNAGFAIPRLIENVELGDWHKQLEVNLTSVYIGVSRAVVLMRKTGGGSIINMSSAAGLVGTRGIAAYAAAKAGMRLFGRSVALECGPDNIRINSVHPGLILTDAQQIGLRDIPEQVAILVSKVPMGRMGEPSDIANCVLFLASDEAKYITGAEFSVDGGMTA